MLIPKKSVTLLFILFCSGLKITADQWTMSGLIADLTGQTLILLLIFGFKHVFLLHSTKTV